MRNPNKNKTKSHPETPQVSPPNFHTLTCPLLGLDMVFRARCTLGCPSWPAVVAGGGSGPAVAAPWAPGMLNSLMAKLWTEGGDFPAPVIDILARLGHAPPLLGEEGNDFVAWPRKEAGRRGRRVSRHAEGPLAPPLPRSPASHPAGFDLHLPPGSRVRPR